MSNREKIDELTKELFNGATSAFASLKQLEMLTINISIATAKLQGNPEGRALAKSAEIINDEIVKLEDSTKSVRDMAKEIGRLNKEEINE